MQSEAPASFDELQRAARSLEHDLTARFARLERMRRAPDVEIVLDGASSASGPPAALAALDAEQRELDETERALARLAELVERLGHAATGVGAAHTVQRHREHVALYRQDARAARAAIDARRERAELLSGASARGAAAGDSAAARAETMLRERSSLANAHAAADAVLHAAVAAREGLAAQRTSLIGSQSRVLGLVERLPIVGGLISRIWRRRMRDTLIVALVIAVCAALLLIYIVR